MSGAVPYLSAIYPSGGDAGVEGLALEWTPAAFVVEAFGCDGRGAVRIHQHEVGIVPLAEISSFQNVEAVGWGMAHFLDQKRKPCVAKSGLLCSRGVED